MDGAEERGPGKERKGREGREEIEGETRNPESTERYEDLLTSFNGFSAFHHLDLFESRNLGLIMLIS